MEKILLINLIFGIVTIPSFANSIIYYKLKNIIHPVLDYNNPKPLIIDFEYQWNGRSIETKSIRCTPMIYKNINIQNGKEYIDYQSSKITYYDAYERPDKKGFVLFKKTTEYEGIEPFEEIQVWNFVDYVFLEPHGTNVYISGDYKYLVTILFPYTEGDPAENTKLTLYYYNLTNLPFLYNKPVKEIKIKMPELSKFSLIELK